MRIDIWQMVRYDRMHYLRFEDYENYKRETGHDDICPDDYECVFCGNVNCEGLDEVFQKFNGPVEGFIGHSLSVSDIVYMSEGKYQGLWYCDPFGWTRVHWGKFDE